MDGDLTPLELVILDKADTTGIAGVAGTFVSWILFGGLFVQVPQYFLSVRRSPGQGRVQLAGLLAVLALTVVNNVLHSARMIQVNVYHWGDTSFIAQIFSVPLQNSNLFLSDCTVALCQFILIYRTYRFGVSFRGTSGRSRLAYIGLLTALALAALGIGQYANYSQINGFKSIVEFADADVDPGSSQFDVTEAAWMAICLSVDVLQTAILSVDLFSAITYNSNDVGVGRNLRELLWRLLKLTLVNGTVLVCLQLGLLVAFVSSNTGWSLAFQTVMPCLRVASLFSYLCSPEQSRAAQQLRETQNHDDVGTGGQRGGAPSADLEAAHVTSPTSRPARSAPLLSDAERRRRKLPPATGGVRARAESVWKALNWSAARHRKPTPVALPLSRLGSSGLVDGAGDISSGSSSGSASGGQTTRNQDGKDRQRAIVTTVADRQAES